MSPSNFFPPPHVDSSVLRLNRRPVFDADGEPLDDALLKATCAMADAAFASRRKTISNSFKTYFASRGNAGKAFSGAFPTCSMSAELMRNDAVRRSRSTSSLRWGRRIYEGNLTHYSGFCAVYREISHEN